MGMQRRMHVEQSIPGLPCSCSPPGVLRLVQQRCPDNKTHRKSLLSDAFSLPQKSLVAYTSNPTAVYTHCATGHVQELHFACPCGKRFRNALGLGGHKATCKASFQPFPGKVRFSAITPAETRVRVTVVMPTSARHIPCPSCSMKEGGWGIPTPALYNIMTDRSLHLLSNSAAAPPSHRAPCSLYASSPTMCIVHCALCIVGSLGALSTLLATGSLPCSHSNTACLQRKGRS